MNERVRNMSDEELAVAICRQLPAEVGKALEVLCRETPEHRDRPTAAQVTGEARRAGAPEDALLWAFGYAPGLDGRPVDRLRAGAPPFRPPIDRTELYCMALSAIYSGFLVRICPVH